MGLKLHESLLLKMFGQLIYVLVHTEYRCLRLLLLLFLLGNLKIFCCRYLMFESCRANASLFSLEREVEIESQTERRGERNQTERSRERESQRERLSEREREKRESYQLSSKVVYYNREVKRHENLVVVYHSCLFQ